MKGLMKFAFLCAILIETVFVVKANNVGYSDGSPNEKITKKNEFAITTTVYGLLKVDAPRNAIFESNKILCQNYTIKFFENQSGVVNKFEWIPTYIGIQIASESLSADVTFSTSDKAKDLSKLKEDYIAYIMSSNSVEGATFNPDLLTYTTPVISTGELTTGAGEATTGAGEATTGALVVTTDASTKKPSNQIKTATTFFFLQTLPYPSNNITKGNCESFARYFFTNQTGVVTKFLWIPTLARVQTTTQSLSADVTFSTSDKAKDLNQVKADYIAYMILIPVPGATFYPDLLTYTTSVISSFDLMTPNKLVVLLMPLITTFLSILTSY